MTSKNKKNWEKEFDKELNAGKFTKDESQDGFSIDVKSLKQFIAKELAKKDKEYEIELNHTADFQYKLGKLKSNKEFIEILNGLEIVLKKWPVVF